MSSSWSNDATWLPFSVLHVVFGLTPQDSVTLVNVFWLIVDCWYVKIFSGFLYRVHNKFLPMIPAKMTFESEREVRGKHEKHEKRSKWNDVEAHLNTYLHTRSLFCNVDVDPHCQELHWFQPGCFPTHHRLSSPVSPSRGDQIPSRQKKSCTNLTTVK